MHYTPIEYVVLALAGALFLLVLAIAYREWKVRRLSPEERERRRRAALVASGKMGDALLVEFRDGHIFYSYQVRGVEYTASQDVSVLDTLLPNDLSQVGPVAVRYDVKNPANSIVISETWNGVRAH